MFHLQYWNTVNQQIYCFKAFSNNLLRPIKMHASIQNFTIIIFLLHYYQCVNTAFPCLWNTGCVRTPCTYRKKVSSSKTKFFILIPIFLTLGHGWFFKVMHGGKHFSIKLPFPPTSSAKRAKRPRKKWWLQWNYPFLIKCCCWKT